MEISRLWGQTPEWFFRLPHDERMRLFAWYRLHRDPKRLKKSTRRARADGKASVWDALFK